MSIYAIGDIQGCYTAFSRLLDKIKFDPAQDQLWLVGDLVNRGGKSLEVLRKVYALRDNVQCVLGNHDLHLLAEQSKPVKKISNSEFKAIYTAEDGEQLLQWLRHQPLLHVDQQLKMVMVHAGIPPDWNLKTAQRLTRKVSKSITGDKRDKYFSKMYGNKPARWEPGLSWSMEMRAITNAVTRMRFCKPDGCISYSDKGGPGSQKKSYQPWFEYTGKISGYTILFGHWSALGLYFGNQVVGLDSGCVWGGKLTALRLGERFNLIQVKGRTG